jgi:hypothetical protein
MEAKSPTMSEDLLRSFSPRRGRKLLLAFAGFMAHVGALLVEIWRMFRSG